VVEERLAAGAKVIRGLTSLYWWQAKLERSGEAPLILKSRAGAGADHRIERFQSCDCLAWSGCRSPPATPTIRAGSRPGPDPLNRHRPARPRRSGGGGCRFGGAAARVARCRRRDLEGATLTRS
jgi:CutA1 divalent ion tolerance protein